MIPKNHCGKICLSFFSFISERFQQIYPTLFRICGIGFFLRYGLCSPDLASLKNFYAIIFLLLPVSPWRLLRAARLLMLMQSLQASHNRFTSYELFVVYFIKDLPMNILSSIIRIYANDTTVHGWISNVKRYRSLSAKLSCNLVLKGQ